MMKDLLSSSHLFGTNAAYIDELYEAYLQGQEDIAPEWKRYFDQMQVQPGPRDVPHEPVRELIARIARERSGGGRSSLAPAELAELGRKQAAIFQLVSSYRFLGVRHANLDPLKRLEKPEVPELDPATHGLTEGDLDRVFDTGTLVGPQQAPLRDILKALKETYCGTLGLEYMHITDTAQKRWLQQRFEGPRSHASLSADSKVQILERLTAAEVLEKYLHTKYVGQKRFSLEGGDSLIPMLDNLLQRAGGQGVQELVIGMAHRGRLNVLVNTLGKIPKDLFLEFEGKKAGELPAGDVKYHQGFSSDVMTPGGPMHITLAFNPSHLEIVNPVVEGSVRARQHRRRDREGRQVLPVLIHGDAAFAGQGVVMETLNLSQTRGYGTGGTVHIIVNNQIGFTTSDPRDTRSTIYCTDVAKMVEAPVIHVNGDDPEAVIFAIEAAMDFRTEFQKDVVVDLVCFRKLGHNEQDEPMVTQPLMYKIISQHPGTRKLYADRLVTEGVIKEGDAERMIADYRKAMDEGHNPNKSIIYNYRPPFQVDWAPYIGAKWNDPVDTGLPMDELRHLSDRLTAIPSHFKLHARVDKVIADRRQMGLGQMPLDWGMAENLAYASLLKQGYGVRLSGQDAGRGTFFHRHAVLHDQNRERWDAGTYVPLQNITENQPDFVVIDSTLSEEAVLGFEYGYSCAEPNELTIWEAQFGDFANGAQVVIDQFITSGEAKWGRMSGLTMFLPHGYEGQGPEHSSARLERYLQLCAEHNVQVCVPSTPAQVFHLLRRQMVRPFRKPLIVMTPKSLLRKREAVSSLKELAKGSFQTVIGEIDALEPKQVTRIVACSGKVYYDLLIARRERRLDNVAIIRVEQLYPFPHKQFAAEMKRYPGAAEVVWCQEEPQNQGAWYQTQHYLEENMRSDQRLYYAGRPSAAAPAGGSLSRHNQRQKALVEQAFGKYK